MADAAFFGKTADLLLPAGVERLTEVRALKGGRWALLALSVEGCRLLARCPETEVSCGIVLLPSGWSGLVRWQIRAERVVSCGLSRRDSLTFSSMDEGRAVVCVQRMLTRLDGGQVEPQELPVRRCAGPPEDLLVAVGLGLLL